MSLFTLAPCGRGWREAPGEGKVKTIIIYTALTLPSLVKGEGKRLTLRACDIRRVAPPFSLECLNGIRDRYRAGSACPAFH